MKTKLVKRFFYLGYVVNIYRHISTIDNIEKNSYLYSVENSFFIGLGFFNLREANRSAKLAIKNNISYTQN